MKAMVLIAANFVRQQRIVTFIFLAWLVGFGVVFGLAGGRDPDDILALFRQQAAYGVVYTLFLATSSVHGERKSRRILAVLSKGIHRHEYIGGLMLGCVMMTVLYMVSLGAVNMWLSLKIGFSAEIWSTIVAATLAATVLSAIAIAFSTFAHPLVATVGTLLVAGFPTAFQFLFGAKWAIAAPSIYVVREIFHSNFQSGWSGGWAFAPIAIAETMLFWFIAGAIFQRRDVTVAIE